MNPDRELFIPDPGIPAAAATCNGCGKSFPWYDLTTVPGTDSRSIALCRDTCYWSRPVAPRPLLQDLLDRGLTPTDWITDLEVTLQAPANQPHIEDNWTQVDDGEDVNLAALLASSGLSKKLVEAGTPPESELCWWRYRLPDGYGVGFVQVRALAIGNMAKGQYIVVPHRGFRHVWMPDERGDKRLRGIDFRWDRVPAALREGTERLSGPGEEHPEG